MPPVPTPGSICANALDIVKVCPFEPCLHPCTCPRTTEHQLLPVTLPCSSNPDLAKVRQFDQPRRYPSLPAALRQIAAEEGVLSGLLLRGDHSMSGRTA